MKDLNKFGQETDARELLNDTRFVNTHKQSQKYFWLYIISFILLVFFLIRSAQMGVFFHGGNLLVDAVTLYCVIHFKHEYKIRDKAMEKAVIEKGGYIDDRSEEEKKNDELPLE